MYLAPRLGERETSHEWLFSGARACTQRRDDGKRRVGWEEGGGGGNGGGYNRGLMKPVEVRQTGSASSPFATLVLSPLPAPHSTLPSPPPVHSFGRSLVRSFVRVEGIPVSRQNRDIDLFLSVSLPPSISSFVSNASSVSLSLSVVPLWLRSPCRTAYLRHRSPPVTLALVCPPM